MLDILAQVNEWLAQGQRVALATVVQTWGSSPRRVGSKMAVSETVAMAGSVSGGCVETAVVQEALRVLKHDQPRFLHYGVSDDDAWEVGLACGGKIDILVELLDARWWALAADAVQHNRTLTTLTILEGDCAGAKFALDSNSEVVYSNDRLPAEPLQTLIGSTPTKQSGRAALAGYEVMVDAIQARPHLIIIGGVHIAVALQGFAKSLGFRVTLVDPRSTFASEERFPDADGISHTYPDKALAQIGIDGDTYIAVLTHDPKIDDPAIKAALAAKPAYIGILSGKRTHEKRVERLTKAGFDEAELARLKTPIGLAIGAETPEEIALAVMAEIIAVKNANRRGAALTQRS
jgi:xanthine dehydrogenase accessory factor